MAGGDNYCLNSLIININYGVFTKYSRTRTRTKLAGFYEQKSFCNCNDGRFCKSIEFFAIKRNFIIFLFMGKVKFSFWIFCTCPEYTNYQKLQRSTFSLKFMF